METALMDRLLQKGKPDNQTSKLKIKYKESSFESKTFRTQVNDEDVLFATIKMKDSLLLWIGKSRKPEFFDLAVAMPPKNEYSASSKIVGSELNTFSVNLANKLTNKLNKPVFVSCNINVDTLSLPYIEKCVYDWLKLNEEQV